MAEVVHRSRVTHRNDPRGGAALALALLALGISALGGCLVARETRQMASETTLRDSATGQPLPGGQLVVRADRGKANLVVRHRYTGDSDGRLRAPEIRGWTYVLGLPLPRNIVAQWRNEQTYFAPGHAWLRIPVDQRLGSRPPDQVLLRPLPAGAPRVRFGEAPPGAWSGLDTWEIAVPACEGHAQGLREGDGRVVYWDPQRVITAASLEMTPTGIRFEDSPRLARVQIIEAGRTKTPRRVFLNGATCALDFGAAWGKGED
ncbi:MAG: hypothetical protein ACE5FC_05295 [Myxococcota bacterium]